MKKYFRYISLSVAFAIVFLLCSCADKRSFPPANTSSGSVSSNYDDIQSQEVIPDDSGSKVVLETAIAAPTFKEGEYSLVITNTKEQENISNGSVASSYVEQFSYYYDLSIKPLADTTEIDYTITRVTITITDSSGPSTFDTNNDAARGTGLDKYYNIIGKKFKAVLDSDGNLSEIKDHEEFLALYDIILGSDSINAIKGIVNDTFYQLPQMIDSDTSFETVQADGGSELTVNYVLNAYRGGRLGFTFKSNDANQIPPPSVSAETTLTYKTYEPMTGTLWINENDRALIEYTTYRTTSGVLDIESGSSKVSADVNINLNSSCKISEKAN